MSPQYIPKIAIHFVFAQEGDKLLVKIPPPMMFGLGIDVGSHLDFLRGARTECAIALLPFETIFCRVVEPLG